MKILLWSPLGAGTHYHGSGMNAYRHYAANKTKDLKITLVCAYPGQDNLDCFDEIVVLHKQHSNSLFSYLIYQVKARRWLSQNAHRFDVFHGIDVFDNTLRPAVYAEKLGLPAVIKPAQSKAGFISANRVYRIFGLAYLRRRLIRKVSAVIAINSQIAEELESYGVSPDRIHRIPNGVDIQTFHPVDAEKRKSLRKELGIEESSFVILFVGAVTPRKQPHLLLDAVKTLIPEYPQLRLFVLGPLPDTAYCQHFLREISDSSLETHVIMKNHQQNILPYYQIADLLCLPSLNEGMPNAILEAMACGLPCLASAVPGITELIQSPDEGILLNKSESIKDTIKDILSHPMNLETIKCKSRIRVQSSFDVKDIFSQYFSLFQSLTKI